MKKKNEFKSLNIEHYLFWILNIYKYFLVFFNCNIDDDKNDKKKKKKNTKELIGNKKADLNLIKQSLEFFKSSKKGHFLKTKKLHKLVGSKLSYRLHFFKDFLSYVYHPRSMRYWQGWFKRACVASEAKRFNFNKLVLYLCNIYKFILFYNKKKQQFVKKIIKLNNTVVDTNFKKQVFLNFNSILNYRDNIFYYFDIFYKKLSVILDKNFCLNNNYNYLSFSFKLKNWKYASKKKLNIFKSFNMIYIFNNIIYKFLFFLNMYWINLHSCNNVINYSNFYDIKKNNLIFFNVFSSFIHGWRKERKLNHIEYMNANNIFLYAKALNINNLLL